MRLFFTKPKRAQGSIEDQIDSIRRALYALSDDLEKVLDNIDTDNLSEGLKTKIEALEMDVKSLTKNAEKDSQSFKRVISDTEGKLSTRISQTESAIVTEATNRSNADTSLSSRITQTARSLTVEINSKIGSSEAQSLIDATIGSITLSTTGAGSSGSISIALKDSSGNVVVSDTLSNSTLADAIQSVISISADQVLVKGSTTFSSMVNNEGQIVGSYVDGANVTNIDGGHITTGTISANRISTTLSNGVNGVSISNNQVTATAYQFSGGQIALTHEWAVTRADAGRKKVYDLNGIEIGYVDV